MSGRGKGGGKARSVGKGRGRADGREEHMAGRSGRPPLPPAPESRKPELRDVIREVESRGDDDFVELAKSFHALLRLEAVSHDALVKRVGCPRPPTYLCGITAPAAHRWRSWRAPFRPQTMRCNTCGKGMRGGPF